MFLTIWHYLNGYVIVEVSGMALERFMNLIINRELEVWELKVQEDKAIFKMKAADFKALGPIVKKTRCRARICTKKGFPFLAHRYKKRKLMPVGLLLFIMMIWGLSSFVWLVEVEGATRLNSMDIIKSLEEQGYGVGKWKNSLDLRAAEAYLVKAYPDIVWTAVKFEGTRLVIQVAETVPPPDMVIATGETTHIVAKRDALVTSISVDKGMPQVKKGDIVKKGEVLVSGHMPLGAESESIYSTDSKAKVLGKTVYSATGEMNLTRVRKQYTNDTSKRYILKLFNHDFTLWNQKINFETYDTQTTLHQLHITKLFPLPFGFEVQTRIAYTPTYETLSVDDAKDLLLSQLWQELSGSLSEDADILKREILYKESGETIEGTLHVVAEENIGYKVIAEPIVQPEVSSEGENAHE